MRGRIWMVATIAVMLVLVSGLAVARGPQEPAAAVDYGRPGEFPLQNTLEVTGGFNVIGGRSGMVRYDLSTNPIYRAWEDKTNVKVDWMFIESEEQRSVMFAADDYPDFVTADGLWTPHITRWMQEGVVLDLAPMLGQGYTPNLDRLFDRYPEVYSYMLTPDGNFGAVPNLRMLKSHYLEQNFMINKVWLDRLGLGIPTTVDELRNVLIAFRDGDPRRSGRRDELPFGFIHGDGFAQHLMSLAGWAGLVFKEPVAFTDDYEAVFAPSDPAYKEFIQYLASLYTEGLIDPESFTQGRPEFDAKVDADGGSLYGFIIAIRGYIGTPGREEFVSIPPMAVPGRQPGIWLHPGWMGTKGGFFLTDSAPEPEILLSWWDARMTLEHSVEALHGPIGQGVRLINGVYTPNPAMDAEWIERNAGWMFPFVIEAEDYGTRYALDDATAFLDEMYEQHYADYVTLNQWQRPDLSAAHEMELARIRPDIRSLWKSNEARWITGAGSIEAEWDAYLRRLDGMNLQRKLQIYEEYHRRFMAEIE